MRKLVLVSSIGLLSATAVAQPKTGAPKPKAPPACGIKVLPFVEGNTWTYASVAPPAPPDEKLAKISPTPVKQIQITVTKVAPQGQDTVISLDEKLTVEFKVPTPGKPEPTMKTSDRTLNTTIVCNATTKKFEISPDSFFFAGEPGGFLNMTFDKVDRVKSASAQGMQFTNGTIGEGEFREDVAAHWNRTATKGTNAKPTSGKLELERKFTPQQPEQIVSKAGNWKAEKLGLTTTGRVTLDQAHPEDKPMELPAGWTTQMWLVDGVGLVQALNGYSHMYQLVDYAPK